MTQKIIVVEVEANIEQVKNFIYIKDKDARLMTLECESKLVQDDIIKVGNEYDQTVEFKEVSTKSLKDAVTNIQIYLINGRIR